MKESDLFVPSEPKPERNGKHHGTTPAFPTAAAAVEHLEHEHGPAAGKWTYRHEDNKPCGMVLRWDLSNGRKTFRPLSRSVDGWRIEAMPVPRPLFDLPEVIQADVVVVNEGEKASDAARNLGFDSTTSPGGAQAAGKTNWRPLAGKRVIISPDNDEPGRKYADEVAGFLAKLTPPARVTILQLPAYRPAVTSWIGSRPTAMRPSRKPHEGRDRGLGMPPPEPKPRYEFIPTDVFMAGDYRLEWAIRQAMVPEGTASR